MSKTFSEYQNTSGAQSTLFASSPNLDFNEWRLPLYKTPQFSFDCLCKASMPALLLGAALCSAKLYLPLMITAPIPPIAFAIMIVAGSLLIAYGLYQGLQYANTPTLQEGYEEDVEPLEERPQSCWDRLGYF